jgi:hypothetical protein
MSLRAVIFDFYGTLVNEFGSSIPRHMDFVKALEVPEEPFKR